MQKVKSTCKIFFMLLGAVSLILTFSCGKKVSPQDGVIYYTVQEVGRFRIERMNKDGGDVEVILGEEQVKDALAEDINTDENGRIISADKNDHSTDSKLCSVSHNGNRLAYLWGSPSGIRVYNLKSKQVELEINSDDAYMRPDFSRTEDVLVYSRVNNERKRCQVIVHKYPLSPKIILELRNMLPAVWNNAGGLYYTDIDAEMNHVVCSCAQDGTGVKTVLKNASSPVPAPFGQELLVISDDKLQLFDVKSKKMAVIVDEPGISSPTWSPDGKNIAYLKGNRVYTVDMVLSGEPKEISDPLKKVTDVCWGKYPR